MSVRVTLETPFQPASAVLSLFLGLQFLMGSGSVRVSVSGEMAGVYTSVFS